MQHPQPAGGKKEEGVSLLSRSCHDTTATGSSARGCGSQQSLIHAPARRLTSPRLSYLRAQHGVIRAHCPFGHLHVWYLCDISREPHRCTGRDTHTHTHAASPCCASAYTHSHTHSPTHTPLLLSFSLSCAQSRPLQRKHEHPPDPAYCPHHAEKEG